MTIEMVRYQGQPDRRLLASLLLVSVLVQQVTCIGPLVKRMSSPCRCHNKGVCITEPDGSHSCICPEGYHGPKCDFDCRGASDTKCKSFKSWKICVRHRDWMDVCCKGTCQGLKNTCGNANPVQCKLWEARGHCNGKQKWMRICCGLCFGNSKCRDKHPVQCPLWKANGECRKNKVWMYENCLESCLGR